MRRDSGERLRAALTAHEGWEIVEEGALDEENHGVLLARGERQWIALTLWRSPAGNNCFVWAIDEHGGLISLAAVIAVIERPACKGCPGRKMPTWEELAGRAKGMPPGTTSTLDGVPRRI